MKLKNLIGIPLVFGWLFALATSVCAHDPGLSRASVQQQESGLAMHMVFALPDLEVLMPVDTDQNSTVSADEFVSVRDNLRSIITNGISVQQVGVRLLPTSGRVDQLSGDAVSVELSYDREDASPIHIQIPLVAQLARGHRHYLTVQDAAGNLLAQHILDASSPPVVLDGNSPSGLSVFREYLTEGIWHIWIGFDHILFLLTLLLPAVLVYRKPHWRSLDNLGCATMDLLKVVTAFTAAHSITLALAVLDIVTLPPRLVEPVIALSVLITAVNNLRPVFPASRWLLAFAFGLIHGFGFAGVLLDLGLPSEALFMSLLGFNLGVEAGQLVIVALVFPAAALLRHRPFYRIWVFNGGSAAAALIATVWMFERIFGYELLGF